MFAVISACEYFVSDKVKYSQQYFVQLDLNIYIQLL